MRGIGFEPMTLRTSSECSTTELTALALHFFHYLVPRACPPWAGNRFSFTKIPQSDNIALFDSPTFRKAKLWYLMVPRGIEPRFAH